MRLHEVASCLSALPDQWMATDSVPVRNLELLCLDLSSMIKSGWPKSRVQLTIALYLKDWLEEMELYKWNASS